MRRRAASTPPPELLAAPMRPADGDLGVWAAAYRAWCAARLEWVEAGGVWPGGEDQRQIQEAIATPDEPVPPLSAGRAQTPPAINAGHCQ